MLLHSSAAAQTPAVYVRANQIGYLPADVKIAVAFSHRPADDETFEVVEVPTGRTAFGPAPLSANYGAYANFAFNYQLDFTALKKKGRYRLRLTRSKEVSLPFTIGPNAYNTHHESLLGFMREQRCGYNPFLDEVCHRKDGRSAYGPMPESTYADVSGGWHDAADQLRYLLTSGNAVCRMLFAFEENKGKYRDDYNALGQKNANGIPDILDEAKWGLDWMLKMHPAAGQLFHQVGDDRDHISAASAQHGRMDDRPGDHRRPERRPGLRQHLHVSLRRVALGTRSVCGVPIGSCRVP